MQKSSLLKKTSAVAVAFCLCFFSTVTIASSSIPSSGQSSGPSPITSSGSGGASSPAGTPKPPALTFFNKNIYLDGTDLSSYTYFSANAKFGIISGIFERGFLISATVGERVYEIRPRDIGLKSNTAELLNRLWTYSQSGPPDGEGMSLHTVYTYDEALAKSVIARITDDACADSVPAFACRTEPSFDFESREFACVEPEWADYYDPDDVREALEAALSKAIAHSNEKRAAPVIELTVEPVAVQADSCDTSEYGLIAAFTTRTTTYADRNTNISVACKAVSGTVLEPGDTFSFLGIVGATTLDKGYKMALIIVNGKLVPGMGGGICQVSSTIYNAVLDAGLKVIERHPHSVPVDYVPKGRDATVSLPKTDFRFENDTDHNLYVITTYADRTVTAELYGRLPAGEAEAA